MEAAPVSVAERSPAQILRSNPIATIAIAQLFGTSLWFSANSAAPDLMRAWGIGISGIGLLTNAVQLGFILGTMSIALERAGRPLSRQQNLRSHRALRRSLQCRLRGPLGDAGKCCDFSLSGRPFSRRHLSDWHEAGCKLGSAAKRRRARLPGWHVDAGHGASARCAISWRHDGTGKP